MKTFNSFQEFWSYCKFCPFCQKDCRTISISVGPEYEFKCISFKKENNFFKLYCVYGKRKNEKYKVNYYIDVVTGKFGTEVLELVDTSNIEMNADFSLEEERACNLRSFIAKKHFYFYINGDCKVCNSATLHSSDLELNGYLLQNVGIEKESITICSLSEKYRITILYSDNKVLINKTAIQNNYFNIDNTFLCPIVNFDFSNLQKVINKIKTLLTFS